MSTIHGTIKILVILDVGVMFNNVSNRFCYILKLTAINNNLAKAFVFIILSVTKSDNYSQY